MHQTREEVIDLRYKVEAAMRKAQCRAVDCDTVDTLHRIAKELAELDDHLTELIGD
jgi:hypothetical protein